jgi:hypothetical protein
MVKGTRITNGGSIQIEVISSATTAWAEKSFLTGSRRAQYSVLKRGVAERNGGMKNATARIRCIGGGASCKF